MNLFRTAIDLYFPLRTGALVEKRRKSAVECKGRKKEYKKENDARGQIRPGGKVARECADPEL